MRIRFACCSNFFCAVTRGSQLRCKEDLQLLVQTDEGNLVSRTKAVLRLTLELRQVEALPPHFEAE